MNRLLSSSYRSAFPYAVVRYLSFSVRGRRGGKDEGLSRSQGEKERMLSQMKNLNGRPEQAQVLLSEFEARDLPLSTDIYDAVLTCYLSVRPSLGSSAEALLERMKKNGVKITTHTYLLAMQAMAQSVPPMIESVKKLMNEIEDRGGRAPIHAFNLLLLAYSNVKPPLLKDANAVFSRMQLQGYAPNITTFNTILGMYGKVRPPMVDMAEQAVAGMTATWELEPDMVTYGTLMKVYLSASIEKGLSLLEKMKRDGPAPNVVIYNMILFAYADAHPPRVEEAEKLLDWMETNSSNKQQQQQNDDNINAIIDAEPDLRSYSALLKAYSSSSPPMVAKARGVFHRMERRGLSPTTFSYNGLLAALARADLVQEAESLVREMKAAGITPDRVTYNTLALAYAKSGKNADKATRLLNEMDSMKKGAPDVVSYTTAIMAHANTGSVLEAERLFNDMLSRDIVPTHKTMGAIISACCNAASGKDAAWIRKGMEYLDLSRKYKVGPSIVMINTILAGCSKTVPPSVDIAKQLMQLVAERRLEPSAITYTSLMSVYGAQSDLESIEAAFREMKILGIVPVVATYNVLMWTYAKIGNLERVKEVHDEMKNAKLEGDESTLTAMITAYSNSKSGVPKEEANEFVSKQVIPKVSVPSITLYNAILGLYSKERPIDVAKSEQLLREIERKEVQPNEETFKTIIRTCEAAEKQDLTAKALKVHVERRAAFLSNKKR